MSKLWSGSGEADERANAEVQGQPCRCAGSSVKAAGLSLLYSSGELSQLWCKFYLHANR